MVIEYDDEFILQLVLFKCIISPALIMVGLVRWGLNSDEHFSESITVAASVSYDDVLRNQSAMQILHTLRHLDI